MTNEQIDELLSEIGRAPLITSEEERMLLEAEKEKGADCDEKKRLEQANMRFVVSISQYQNRGPTHEELIQAGKSRLSQKQPRAMNKLTLKNSKSLNSNDLFFVVELERLSNDITH